MLRSCLKLIGYEIRPEKGPVGRLYDLYFDDRSYKMVFGIVSLGKKRFGTRVVVSTSSFASPDHKKKVLSVTLSRSEVRNAPDWDSVKPVYRQRMTEFNDCAPPIDGVPADPRVVDLLLVGSPSGSRPVVERDGDPGIQESRLRSLREVSGYGVWGADGRIGKLADFVVADDKWTLPYMVVAAESGEVTKNVLIPTASIRRISWDDQTIITDISTRLMRTSPQFESAVVYRS